VEKATKAEGKQHDKRPQNERNKKKPSQNASNQFQKTFSKQEGVEAVSFNLYNTSKKLDYKTTLFIFSI
jgi:hypothetical protein